AQRDAAHLLGRRHLEVQLATHRLAQARDVVVLDVPAIAALVARDARASRSLGELRRLDRVGIAGAPGLAQGGDVIDVDREMEHRDTPQEAAAAGSGRSRPLARSSSSAMASIVA